MKPAVFCRGTRREAVIGNPRMEAHVDRDLGRQCGLEIKRRRGGAWSPRPGGLEIVDELTGAGYRDGRDPSEVTVERIRANGSPGWRVRKAFRGAAFTVTETWSATSSEILWAASVHLKARQRARSIQVRQFVPWPEDPYDWKVWTAARHYPALAAQVGNQYVTYGDVCFGTVLPIVTVYDEAKDLGLSLAKPFGLRIPQWGFRFDTYHFGGIHVESGLLGLRPDRDARVELMFCAHAGCWRPALGWLVKKYPDYFKPGNPRTPERLEGGFMTGSAFRSPQELRRAARRGARMVDVHNHFPFYGNYFPDDSEWKTWRWTENPAEARARKEPPNSPQRMERSFRKMQRMGMLALPYLQIAGDAWQPWAEREFPESIAVSPDGRRFPGWKNMHWLMNADPSLPFGQHIDRQIDRFFDLYGDMADGVFWDQACYDFIDIAHDDGITMLDNKPAYRLAFCYEKHAAKLVAELRRRKQFLVANGPVYIELCRGIDAIMAEAHEWIAQVFQYLCAARPMLYFGKIKTLTPATLEALFQECLLLGASCYAAHQVAWPREMDRLHDVYRPMIDRLRGRRLCFDPNPLTVPTGIEGNLFRGAEGEVIVVLVRRMTRERDAEEPVRGVDVEVRLPDAARYGRAVAQGTAYTGQRAVRVQRRGRRLRFAVGGHGAASLVRLIRTDEKGAKR